MRRLLCFLVLISNFNVYAISEIDYEVSFNKSVLPFLDKTIESNFFGEEQVFIHYRKLLNINADKCIVILPGRSEPIEKYIEVLYDLEHSKIAGQFNYYLMDHRGQGQSGRMLLDHEIGFVDDFNNYVKDVETFMDKIVTKENCKENYLLAHSMGAGIGYAYLLKHPKIFSKAILNSPMLKILTKPYSYLTAKSIVIGELAIGRGKKYAIGQSGYDEDLKFEDNKYTNSLPRFNMINDIYNRYPEAKLGGVSNKWLLEIMKGTDKLRSRYAEVKIPMRVFSAADERYSDLDEMIKVCEQSYDCKNIIFLKSKHEILMDKDESRTEAINEIIRFFN